MYKEFFKSFKQAKNFTKMIVLPIILVILVVLFAKTKPFNNSIFLISIVMIDLLIIYFNYYFQLNNKLKLLKLFFITFYLINFLILSCEILQTYNILKCLSSVIYIKDLIVKSGSKGIIVFVLLQILETVCLPIPSLLIIFVGTLIYGSFVCFLLCTTGVLIGTSFSFFIGRKLGFKLLNFLFSHDKVIKYTNILNNNGKYFLVLVFLLPFFPDDLMCLIAGVSNLKYKDFFIITLLTKPIGIFITCFFGTSFKIPFSGWGAVFWLTLIISSVILIFIIIFNKKNLLKYFTIKVNKKNTL